MNNDNTFWLTLWLFILMAVVAIALGVAGIVTAHYDHMAELGYEETVVPGRCSPVWKKVAPAKIEVKCDCPRNDAIYTITNWCQLIDAYCTTSNTFRDVQYYLKDIVATNADDAVNWDMVESPIPGYVVKNGWLIPEEAAR